MMGDAGNIENIDLPHDAMIYQERTPATANAHQTGFYPGGEYTYMKKWEIPEAWRGCTVVLEFEGVADTCRIYMNGDLVTEHVNPYTGIFADVSGYLKYGQENELKVEVCSIEQSSRWYSGAGLYRSVYAWVGKTVHIPAQGVRVTTREADCEAAVVEVEVPICNRGMVSETVQVEITLTGPNGAEAAAEHIPVTVFGESTQMCCQCLLVEHPALWSDETPNLYSCRITISEDENPIDSVNISTGIRTLRLNAKHGLLVNGKPTKLRGTCIHHDNGIIGAATFPDAEYRRCRQMKEAGFNALRSAHHPMSKAMLDACDKLGVLVMDELSDMWTRTKNPHDYANYFPTHWKQDVWDMVEKDYNHPCVILYSTGNEIPEAGTQKGAEWNRRIHAEMKRLDATRYTTNGINGLMAGNDRMGEIMCQATGMTPEQLEAMQQPDEQKRGGADEINGMAEVMVGPLADAIATSPILEEMIGEFAAANDIAGYNYLTALHEEDHIRHPNRVVLGTETFPADIVHLWDIVKRNPHVLGDFTWTGYDYLGEAGCGVFYYDGTMNFNGVYPDRIAYIGDINIIGYRRPISYLREIVFGLRKEPYIAVERVDKYGMPHSQTAWMWKDNVSSWTWPGYEGKPANVDVLSGAEEVELFLNGKSLGRKPAGKANKFAASYEMTYEPGELVAVSYENGQETGRYTLKTAGDDVVLTVDCEGEKLKADGEDLAFVTVRLTDQDGIDNLFAEKEVTVSVEGAGTLQGFGSADPRAIGSYDDTTWKTFDGYVMAVVRAGREAGEIKVTFTAEGCEPKTVTIAVE